MLLAGAAAFSCVRRALAAIVRRYHALKDLKRDKRLDRRLAGDLARRQRQRTSAGAGFRRVRRKDENHRWIVWVVLWKQPLFAWRR
ncbi:hypothetical protein KCP78_14470 [Salmonella enterica subsp. enterica]|nr:hypothetical protein KCP78_14470 [Salmonella enterica subsp. enterica]